MTEQLELSWTHWKYCDIFKLLRQNPEIDYGAWLWYCLGSLTEARKLPGALWQRAGKKKESACNNVSGIWILPPIPLWLPVDWTVRFPPISGKRKLERMYTNIAKHVIVRANAPRVVASLLMSSPRTISISHRLFRCRDSNSRDVVASSPSFSRPAARAPRRPCLRAKVRPIYAVPPSHRKK